MRKLQEQVREQAQALFQLEHTIIKEQQDMIDTGYTQVQFNAPRAARLCNAIQRARKDEAETFLFDGITFFTDYAAYLLQFLCGQMQLSLRQTDEGHTYLVNSKDQIVQPDQPQTVNGAEVAPEASPDH